MTTFATPTDEILDEAMLAPDWDADEDDPELDAGDLDSLDEEEVEAIDTSARPTSRRSAADHDDETIQYYLQDIARYRLLTAEEEQELGRRVARGDEGAWQQLVNSNLRLVVKIAKHYMSGDYPFIDIIQDGNMGLMRAARKFEAGRNVRFSTYAAWWIKQTIIRNLSMKKRMIRVPHRKEEKIRHLNRLMTSWLQDHDRNATDEELARMTGLQPAEVRELMASAGPVISCDQPVGEENSSLLDLLPDHHNDPERDVVDEAVRAHMLEILADLPDREREIIACRYGFDDEIEDNTLKAIGDRFGISAETVRQVEIRALRKIRQKRNHLKAFLH